MTSPIPYFDALGFTNRTIMPSGDVALVTTASPAFLPTLVLDEQKRIEAQLLKRYAVPFGTQQPPLTAAGTTPPCAVISGTPTVGSNEIVIQITTGGVLGMAAFQWSRDGGNTWEATGVLTAASVPLPGTGLAVTFVAGTYDTDNVYAAPTPVPRAALRWLAKIMTVQMYRKRGVNPQDPQIADAADERKEAFAEIAQAADSEKGLFDLPLNDAAKSAASSAITMGTPLSYSEQSPYVWQDRQERAGRGQDGYGR